MQPYQQRVVDELADLEVKLKALHNFLWANDSFDSLPIEDKELLVIQFGAMSTYAGALSKRIERF